MCVLTTSWCVYASAHALDFQDTSLPVAQWVVDSVRGDDTASGRDLSSPFRTLDRARDAMREWRTTVGALAVGGVRVLVRGGEYQPLALSAVDSGECVHPSVRGDRLAACSSLWMHVCYVSLLLSYIIMCVRRYALHCVDLLWGSDRKGSVETHHVREFMTAYICNHALCTFHPPLHLVSTLDHWLHNKPPIVSSC